MDTWHLYVIRTRQRSLYTGITTDVNRRLQEHREGGEKGSKYLRSKGPLSLVYQAKIGRRSIAMKAERAVKRLSKTKKERIVSQKPGPEALFGFLGLESSN